MRQATIPILALALLLSWSAPARAQGFGIGMRMASVKPNVDGEVDVDAVRYYGGQIRLLSQRYGLEVSLDRHSEKFEALNQKVTEMPIQMSVLFRLASGSVAPFLLGGPGWYRRTVEPLDDSALSVRTTEFGWHAGGGLEVLAGKHFGIHGDYRYTFLKFHEDKEESFIGKLLPGHRGSMWTLGATVYF